MEVINLLKKHALISTAILVLVLITFNTSIVYYNNWVLRETTQVKIETERGVFLMSQVWNQVVRNVDIGMRGYALTKKEDLLGPLHGGVSDYPIIMKELRQITTNYAFERPEVIDSIEITVDAFIDTTLAMVELIKMDSINDFKEALSRDPGRGAWLVYEKNSAKVNDFLNALNLQARTSYTDANTSTIFVQTLLLIIALPTLLFIIITIIRDRKSRKNLFLKLEENNRGYLFDPGTSQAILNENEVIDNSIRNFKAATVFINEVSNGNFLVKWEGINEDNEKLNTKNLAGELGQMRDRMKSIKSQDEIRNWMSEGLAKFSDVIRQNQASIQSLSYDVLAYLTQYMNAQQGCLFVLQEDVEDAHLYLEMTACYAFNRKKHISKRIEIGQGIIGQVFLEGQSVMLTDVPSGYTEITSGLGDSTPTCILIIPMKYNEKIEAVIEIAGFEKYEKHQIDFMEKIGEITASTLGSVRNTEKMQHLVNEFKTQTEQLKAQEEELRQNMEEMEATQEAQRRDDKAKR